MADEQTLAVQHKKELEQKEEQTRPGRYYLPNTDIYETEEALVVTMEVPGVEKQNLDVKLEKDVLSVEARVTLSNYDGLEPLYTEYNVGHFARSFSLSETIDQDGISAHVADGVLTLTLQKAKEAVPRRIEIS